MQKQSAILIICLSLVIVIPHVSQAFEYDVWKSGIALDEALKLSEINDIPISCLKFNKPLHRGRDHFRSDVLKQSRKAQNLCYQQNLRGSTALITLHFTPISKKLSWVWIQWTDADLSQQKEVILELTQKYGEPVKYNPQKDVMFSFPDIRLDYDISEIQSFAPDKQNIIVVHYTKKAKKVLKVIYCDRSMTKQEQAELTAFERYIKTRYRQQDENRM